MPLKMAMCFLYQYLFCYGTFVIQENPALRQHKDPRSLGSLPVSVWTFPEVTIIFQGFFSQKKSIFSGNRGRPLKTIWKCRRCK